ncbi:MAG: energy transducer TonB, partial [Cyanobacteria bacterium J06642_11]
MEEEVSQSPPEETPEEEEPPPDEPAASATEPSTPPLPTAAEPVPTDVRSADVVNTEAAIATPEGSIDGQGAVGDSTVIGLVPGSGQPVESEIPRINLPEPSPPVNPDRQPVQEVSLARRRTTSRLVTCNPCSLPDYPTTERREQIEGQPVINAIFDENGRVVDAQLEVSSGNAAFDQAALAEA